jgi:hypothetical protein
MKPHVHSAACSAADSTNTLEKTKEGNTMGAIEIYTLTVLSSFFLTVLMASSRPWQQSSMFSRNGGLS